MSTTLAHYLAMDDMSRRKRDDYFHFHQRLFWVPPFAHSYRHIRHSDECSICLEPFFRFSNSWITQCGHVFHKQCLYSYLKDTPHLLSCPLCRKSLGNVEFVDGWHYQVGITENGYARYLDQLEEIEHMLPASCPYVGDIPSHFKGMNKECPTCRLYRRDGTIR